MIFILITTTFLLSARLTHYFSHSKTVLYRVDEPNLRSLHQQPTPLNGGIAILVAYFINSLALSGLSVFFFPIIWIIISCLSIAIVSFIDDCYTISALPRLIIHFLAALLFLWQTDLWLTQLPFLSWDMPNSLKIIISLLFIVWMVNLYNFMDGMDGFAGGMAVIGFGTFALLGGLSQQWLFMYFNLLLVMACSGFLLFNFPPAQIFMGDVGSSSLGFLAATFSLWGEHLHIFPLWIALLIFSPFIVDATITLLKRLVRKEKFWLPHKSHYYQRLVQLGWGHKRTVLWEYSLMFACSISAIIAIKLPPIGQLTLLIIWGIIYLIIMYLIDNKEIKTK